MACCLSMMNCCLDVGMPLLVLLYAIQQTRMIVRLVRLLRHPARTAQIGFAVSFIRSLCYWPGLMLLLLTLFLVPEMTPSYDANPLELMTFAPFGATLALCSWVAMTLWFRSIVRRGPAIYREPISLVPVAVLSLLCLTYLAGFAWVFARNIVSVGLPMTNASFINLIALAMMLLLLYVPAAPLVGFLLLFFHVALVRHARTWETYVPPEEEEIP